MESRMDMVNGSLGDKIIRYAIPLAATGILQQLFNAADLAVVGQFSGKEAMAAVGGNAPVIGLLVNLFVGISLGSNVIIARSIGQKDEESISKAVHTSVIVALLGGVFLAVLGELLAPFIVELLEVPTDVYPLAIKYLRIYLAGMPVILLYNFEAAVFRSSGNTRTPLAALTVSGVLNVVLNLFFVLGLGMDVDSDGALQPGQLGAVVRGADPDGAGHSARPEEAVGAQRCAEADPEGGHTRRHPGYDFFLCQHHHPVSGQQPGHNGDGGILGGL